MDHHSLRRRRSVVVIEVRDSAVLSAVVKPSSEGGPLRHSVASCVLGTGGCSDGDEEILMAGRKREVCFNLLEVRRLYIVGRR